MAPALRALAVLAVCAGLGACVASVIPRSGPDKVGNATTAGNGANLPAVAPAKPFVPTGRIELPPGWVSQPVPEALAKGGTYFYACNPNINAYLVLTGIAHAGISDVMAYALARRTQVTSAVADSVASDVVPIEIGGRHAFRYTITGKNTDGEVRTILNTVIEGPNEVLVLSTWTIAENFDRQRDVMVKLAENVVGL
jgi:hypothetical protein